MRRFHIDDHTADRLLAGQVAPDDAPAGFEQVARLVQEAGRVALAIDAPPPDAARVAAFVAAAGAGGRPKHSAGPSRAKSRLARFVSVKGLAIATVAVLGAGTAAAATDSLPSMAQSAVSDAASHFGLSVPKGHVNHPGTGKGHGPNVASKASFGLCTAYAAQSANGGNGILNGVAFQDLAKTAAAAGQTVDAYCKTIPVKSDPSTTALSPSSSTDPTSTTILSTTIDGEGDLSAPDGNGSGPSGPPSSLPSQANGQPPTSNPGNGGNHPPTTTTTTTTPTTITTTTTVAHGHGNGNGNGRGGNGNGNGNPNPGTHGGPTSKR